MKFCCDKFAQYVTGIESSSALKPIYDSLGYSSTGQFVKQKDGTWSANGCCGGGCYVVRNMTHCPFCGSDIKCLGDEQLIEEGAQ